MKKRQLMYLAASFLLSACSFPSESGLSASEGTLSSSSGESQDVSSLPSAPANSLIEIDGGYAIKLDSRLLLFKMNEHGGYGLSFLFGEEEAYGQDEPVIINVKSEAGGIMGNYTEEIYAEPYSSLSKSDYGYLLSAVIVTSQGSKFKIEDRYYVPQEEPTMFALERTIEVLEQKGKDEGFESFYSLPNSLGSSDYQDFTYFIPAIIYRDTSEMRAGSIASNLDLTGKVLVKETRTGLPMSMIRNEENGISLALSHLKPEISVEGTISGGTSGSVSSSLNYGSIGFSITPAVGLEFSYPCLEGPNTYDSGAGWAKRFHPIEAGFAQNYALGLILEGEKSYNDGMVVSYQKAYRAEDPQVEDLDMEAIYEDNIEVFDAEYKEFGEQKNFAGVPWSLTLPNASIDQGYSSQMGFVGQQIPVGYHLYRYGVTKDDPTIAAKGQKILDFWANLITSGNVFPNVWWDPSDNGSGGSARYYPTFLRCMVDGAEGLLDGYLTSIEAGSPKAAYYNGAIKIASNLVSVQNANGSFYRAYNTNGTVSTDDSNSAFQGTSELNTPIAVRFLAKCYQLTGEEKYKEAALKAAEYSYENLYLAKGKYVGGTPDNPNTVDKEAAVYAMYCFDSAYYLSGEEKYLKAAEHAAVCSLSWVYVYNFEVPSQQVNEDINVFKDGRTMGFSMIATGHSSADNYAAYIYFALYRLYVETENPFYRSSSILIENASKYSTDYDGRMGFKYRALGPEASTISDFNFVSVGTWLPWSGIANIEPIIHFKTAFGTYDIEDLKLSLDEQKEALAAYGVGGRGFLNI